MRTHDIGTHFWYTVKITKGTPLTHEGTVYQGCYPYQWSDAKFIRIGFKRALVIGNWRPRKAKDVSAHLSQALRQAQTWAPSASGWPTDVAQRSIVDEDAYYGADPERMQ